MVVRTPAEHEPILVFVKSNDEIFRLYLNAEI